MRQLIRNGEGGRVGTIMFLQDIFELSFGFENMLPGLALSM